MGSLGQNNQLLRLIRFSRIVSVLSNYAELEFRRLIELLLPGKYGFLSSLLNDVAAFAFVF